VLELTAGEVELFARPRHVRHHGRGIAAEHLDDLILHFERHGTQRFENAERRHCFRRRLDFVHLLLDEQHPRALIGKADRECQEHESEPVAELESLFDRAQVDGDEAPHRHAVRRLAARLQVVA